MSDDGDNKSDAAMRFIKKKDASKEVKLSQRSDLKEMGRKAVKESGSKQSPMTQDSCGCGQVCSHGDQCIHRCRKLKYNKNHAFYYASPRSPCMSNYWLSDYSSAQFGRDCQIGVNCEGGANASCWNQDGDNTIGVSACDGNLWDDGQHVQYSYKGVSAFSDSYERAQARKRLLHYIQDGTYF